MLFDLRVEGGQMSANSVASAEQKEMGKTVMEFMFDYRYLRDTTRMSPAVTDRMILQVGQGLSKFSSYRTMQVDSLIRMSTADQIQADPGRYIGGQTYSIYKNYPAGKFTTTDKIATDWFLIEEPVPVQAWTMTEETKEVLGYKCKKSQQHHVRPCRICGVRRHDRRRFGLRCKGILPGHGSHHYGCR